MRQFTLFLLFVFLSFSKISLGEGKPEMPVEALVEFQAVCDKLYDEMHLADMISKEAFRCAYEGYTKLSVRNKDIMTVIDFSLPSTRKRLLVLDMVNHTVLQNSLVSHGKKSGELYATSFSNTHGSHKSSLGFFETGNTYSGSNGYSLVLNGLEKGINDQAKARAIVMHGAEYCKSSIIASGGRLGRSFGCPSVPPELTRPIIDAIKDGTLLYIYACDKNYLANSRVVSLSVDV